MSISRLKRVLTLALCLFGAHTHAQYNIMENRVWAFGDRVGLDFNTEPPTLFRTEIISQESNASVASATGDLLFYTNGAAIWNRNHDFMPNANPLHFGTLVSNGPTQSTTQGALIVPFIDSPGKYHVFSLTQVTLSGTGPGLIEGSLHYSVVDMQLDGGLGDADPTRKFVFIDQNLSEKMIAIPGERCNVWVLVHAKNSNCFRAYEITHAGFNPTPVISCVGNASTANVHSVYANTYWSTGELKVSPDRLRLAAAYAEGLLLELYDFDPAAGTVSNAVTFHQASSTGLAPPVATKPYGVSFSADNNMLYTIMGDGNLSQYDLTDPNPVNTRQHIGYTGDFTQMKLAHNGKIFVKGRSAIGVIHNPHRLGIACAYVSSYMALNQGMSMWLGFPNEVAKARSPDTSYLLALDTTLCVTSYTLTGPDGFAEYEWSSGGSNRSLTIEEPGIYLLTSRDACTVRIDTFRIRKDSVVANLGEDLRLCITSAPVELQLPELDDVVYIWQDGSKGPIFSATETGTYYVTAKKGQCTDTDTIHIRFASIEFPLGADSTICIGAQLHRELSLLPDPETSIRWQDGSTEPTRIINDTGIYWITITDPVCGSYSDTLQIQARMCDCEVYIPTAFTPNNDGKNDQFRPVIPAGCAYVSYVLRIYDRWGRVVFTSANLTTGWDGTTNGSPAEIGTYMYEVAITVGSENHEKYFKGDMILLR